MSYFSNLAITATGGLMGSAIASSMNYLQGLLANGGRDKHCKFYHNAGAGGSILRVAAKSIVGGVVSQLKDDAVNAFNSLLNKKGGVKEIGKEWIDSEYELMGQERILYGKMPVNDGNNVVYALDDWGCVATEALMLKIKTETEVLVSQTSPNFEKMGIDPINSFSSDSLVWYDTTALININSDKNLVVTKVTGRDYSRKELVSNGDIKFSVSGQITSGRPDIYPVAEMQKFYKVMQYKGIIEINNQVLDQLGIKRIVIENFSVTPKEGYKAVQNYSFNAIGLQPEQETEIVEDTVKILTPAEMPKEEEKSGWMKMLDNQLNGLKSLATDAVSQGLAIGTGYLDNLL